MNRDNLTDFYSDDNIESDEQVERSPEQIAHEEYADALERYRDASIELEKALGVQKDFEQTSWSAAEAVEDSRRNGDKYALINRFETAVINKLKAKGKI